MMQNAYFLAKIGADTAENERIFAENLTKFFELPTKTKITANLCKRPARPGGARGDVEPRGGGAGGDERDAAEPRGPPAQIRKF